MKLKYPHLPKTLGTIIQENYGFFYPSGPFRMSHFKVRYPVLVTKLLQQIFPLVFFSPEVVLKENREKKGQEKYRAKQSKAQFSKGGFVLLCCRIIPHLSWEFISANQCFRIIPGPEKELIQPPSLFYPRPPAITSAATILYQPSLDSFAAKTNCSVQYQAILYGIPEITITMILLIIISLQK